MPLKLINVDGTKEHKACEHYNWRLDWLEKTICKRHKRGDKLSTEQYQTWYDSEQRTYENMKKDEKRIEKLNKPLGIIVPTHKYHNAWLESTLTQLFKTGYWTMLAFDNPYYQLNQKHDECLPSIKAMLNVDQVITLSLTEVS